MLLVSILALVGFFAILMFFGWQVARKLLDVHEAYLLAPVGALLGTALYIGAANALAYAFGTPLAFFVTLGTFLAGGVAFLFVRGKTELSLHISKKYLLCLGIITAALIAIYALVLLANLAYSDQLFRIYAEFIARGDFPVRDPLNPAYSIQYHYGINLLLAAAAAVSRLPMYVVLPLTLAIIAGAAFSMTFALAYRLTRSVRVGFIAAWLFFFAGGFRYLTIFLHLDYRPAYLVDYAKQIADIVFSNTLPNSMLMGPGYFHAYSVDTYSNLLYHPPTALAMPLVLLVFWLFYERGSSSASGWYSLGIALTLAVLALVSEDKFALLALTLALFGFYRFFARGDFSWRAVRTVLLDYGAVLAGAAGIAIIQGGVVTDFFAGVFGYSKLALIPSLVGTHAFALRLVSGLTSTDGSFYPFTALYSWVYFIVEWGLPLFLFPFVTRYVAQKRNDALSFAYLFSIIAFLLSFVVQYRSEPDVMYRLAASGYMVLGFLLGLALGQWSGSIRWKRRGVLAAIVLMSVSPLFFTIKGIPLKPFLHGDGYTAAEHAAALAVQRFIPADAIVLARDPSLAAELLQRYTYETDHKQWNIQNDLFVSHLASSTVADLAARHIDYLFVDPAFKASPAYAFVKKQKTALTPLYGLNGQYTLYTIP